MISVTSNPLAVHPSPLHCPPQTPLCQVRRGGKSSRAREGSVPAENHNETFDGVLPRALLHYSTVTTTSFLFLTTCIKERILLVYIWLSYTNPYTILLQLCPFEFVFRLCFNLAILVKDYVINEFENVLLRSLNYCIQSLSILTLCFI